MDPWLLSVEDRLNTLYSNASKLHKNRADNLIRIEEQKKNCHAEIRAFRKDLNNYLDTIEKRFVFEMSTLEREQKRKIQSVFDELESFLRILNILQIKMNDIKRLKAKDDSTLHLQEVALAEKESLFHQTIIKQPGCMELDLNILISPELQLLNSKINSLGEVFVTRVPIGIEFDQKKEMEYSNDVVVERAIENEKGVEKMEEEKSTEDKNVSSEKQTEFLRPSFDKAVGTDDKDLSVEKNIHWGIDKFNDWRQSRNELLRKSFVTKDQYVPSIDSNMSHKDLNYWLKIFVKEVRRKDGSDYPAEALRIICNSIWEYLKCTFGEMNFDPSDKQFSHYQQTLSEQLLKLDNKNPSVSIESESTLWECLFSDYQSNAQNLSYAVYYYNCEKFGLKTAEDHYALNVAQFSTAKDRLGYYLLFRDYSSKFIKRQSIKHYMHAESQKCLVQLFLYYLRSIPPQGPFYRQPLQGSFNDMPRFSKERLKIDELQNYTKMFCELTVNSDKNRKTAHLPLPKTVVRNAHQIHAVNKPVTVVKQEPENAESVSVSIPVSQKFEDDQKRATADKQMAPSEPSSTILTTQSGSTSVSNIQNTDETQPSLLFEQNNPMEMEMCIKQEPNEVDMDIKQEPKETFTSYEITDPQSVTHQSSFGNVNTQVITEANTEPLASYARPVVKEFNTQPLASLRLALINNVPTLLHVPETDALRQPTGIVQIQPRYAGAILHNVNEPELAASHKNSTSVFVKGPHQQAATAPQGSKNMILLNDPNHLQQNTAKKTPSIIIPIAATAHASTTYSNPMRMKLARSSSSTSGNFPNSVFSNVQTFEINTTGNVYPVSLKKVGQSPTEECTLLNEQGLPKQGIPETSPDSADSDNEEEELSCNDLEMEKTSDDEDNLEINQSMSESEARSTTQNTKLGVKMFQGSTDEKKSDSSLNMFVNSVPVDTLDSALDLEQVEPFISTDGFQKNLKIQTQNKASKEQKTEEDIFATCINKKQSLRQQKSRYIAVVKKKLFKLKEDQIFEPVEILYIVYEKMPGRYKYDGTGFLLDRFEKGETLTDGIPKKSIEQRKGTATLKNNTTKLIRERGIKFKFTPVKYDHKFLTAEQKTTTTPREHDYTNIAERQETGSTDEKKSDSSLNMFVNSVPVDALDSALELEQVEPFTSTDSFHKNLKIQTQNKASKEQKTDEDIIAVNRKQSLRQQKSRYIAAVKKKLFKLKEDQIFEPVEILYVVYEKKTGRYKYDGTGFLLDKFEKRETLTDGIPRKSIEQRKGTATVKNNKPKMARERGIKFKFTRVKYDHKFLTVEQKTTMSVGKHNYTSIAGRQESGTGLAESQESDTGIAERPETSIVEIQRHELENIEVTRGASNAKKARVSSSQPFWAKIKAVISKE